MTWTLPEPMLAAPRPIPLSCRDGFGHVPVVRMPVRDPFQL